MGQSAKTPPILKATDAPIHRGIMPRKNQKKKKKIVEDAKQPSLDPPQPKNLRIIFLNDTPLLPFLEDTFFFVF